MKKTIVLVFAICMGMAVTACSSKSSSDSGNKVETVRPAENSDSTNDTDAQNTTEEKPTESAQNEDGSDAKPEEVKQESEENPAAEEHPGNEENPGNVDNSGSEEHPGGPGGDSGQQGEMAVDDGQGPSIPKKVTEEGYSGKAESEYIGEYKDPDTGNAGLEIAKVEDGVYTVQISIANLTTFHDGVGELSESGMSFIASDPNGTPIGGVIKIDGNKAIVTFTGSSWDLIAEGTSFEYEKTSDTPNLWS